MVFIYCPRKEETSKKHLAVVVKSYLLRKLCPDEYCSKSVLKCDNPDTNNKVPGPPLAVEKFPKPIKF